MFVDLRSIMKIFVLVLFALAQFSVCNTRVVTNLDCDRYLHRYGYLRGSFNPDSGREALLSERTYALQWYQQFSNIPNTGVCDATTKQKMNLKRCACEDVMTKEELMNTTIASQPQQFNLGPKWPRTDLTYRLNGYSQVLRDNNVIRSEIRRAFRVWENVTTLRFRELTSRSGDADIDISFEVDDHGDGRYNAFDGRGGVLAHAFFPTTGTTHFDDRERWVIRSDEGTDFFTVAAHEFGHALGLAHSGVSGALMAPYYAGYDPNFELHIDDIQGIQSLYGGTTTRPFTRPPVSLTTMRPARRTTPRPRPTPRPRVTNRPPVTRRPTPRPRPQNPDCNKPIIAAVRDFDGSYLLVMDRRFMYKVDMERGTKSKSTIWSTFRRAPINPGAIYNLPNMGMTFFMRGQKIWQFDRMRNRMQSIFVQGGGSTMPERPMAAFTSLGNTIWVLGRSIAWRMTPRGEVIRGSHTYIRSAFPGVPTPVDSAVNADTNTVYFFKDQTYYEFSMQSERVVRSGNIGQRFLFCR